MYLDKSSETKWIIKSENKILGPYNFDQIVDLIRKKQISLIDEVRDPETRWLYVRENPEFKNVVDEIRKEIDSKAESTKTYQSISRSFDDPMQKTKTDVNHFTDINLETKDVDVVNEILSAANETKIQTYSQAKTYGTNTDKVVQKKVNSFFNKTLVTFAIVLITALFSFFGYIYVQKRSVSRQEEALALQIKKYKYLGFNQKAVDSFSRLPSANQKKIIPELLEIYPMLEPTGLVGIEDIRALRSHADLSPEQKANIELIYFRQAMQQNSYGEAQDYLVKATAIQPSSFLIKENEALLYLKKRQFMNAYNIFKAIFSQEKNGRYLLGMVESYYGLSTSDRNQKSKELLSDLEKYTAVYYDYNKELLLAQIAMAQEFNETVLYKVSKGQFFNTPGRLSDEFAKPSLLAPDSYSWSELKEILADVYKTLSNDELVLFQLHDYLEAKQLSAAAEFVSGNVSKVSSATVRAQMNLLLFDAQKRNNEVIALEKSNQLDMNSELNHWLIARNKIELGSNEDISKHLQFLSARQLVFYKDWLELEQLIKKNAIDELKAFVKDHFITIQNFNPVLAARSLVD